MVWWVGVRSQSRNYMSEMFFPGRVWCWVCEGRYGISTSLIANNCLYTAQNIYYTCLNAPTFHPSKVYLFPSESECQSESKNRVRIEIRIRIQIRIRIRPAYLPRTTQPNPNQTPKRVRRNPIGSGDPAIKK